MPTLVDKTAFLEFAISSVIFRIRHLYASLILLCIQAPPFFAWVVPRRCYLLASKLQVLVISTSILASTDKSRPVAHQWLLTYRGCEFLCLKLGRQDITSHSLPISNLSRVEACRKQEDSDQRQDSCFNPSLTEALRLPRMTAHRRRAQRRV